ncbi:MAG: hypothetical protein ACOY3K_03775 [Candidatus Omnitrophota bacterium]
MGTGVFLRKNSLSLFFFIWAAGVLTGCGSSSYPGDRLEQSIRDICAKEYQVYDVSVKVAGQTVGVFLPVSNLFSADFSDEKGLEKAQDLESLFQPSEEALDRIDDVLFTISRVIMSTDKNILFYILQVGDQKNPGIELLLTGNVDDIKRVRVWDISRDEYRKRVFHEIRFNQPLIWHQRIRRFFESLSTGAFEELSDLTDLYGEDSIDRFFLDLVPGASRAEALPRWEIRDIRSAMENDQEAIVYVRAAAVLDREDIRRPAPEFEYFFSINVKDSGTRITKIIPFQFVNTQGEFERVTFPKELRVEENLAKWSEDFTIVPVRLGDFLAKQISRRVEAILMNDERVLLTLEGLKIDFEYQEADPNSSFVLNVEALPREVRKVKGDLSEPLHEDLLYLIDLAMREFVKVTHSYGFSEYEYLQLNLVRDMESWIFPQEDLERFRRRKIGLAPLLSDLNGL